jgi:hypothetical protein
MFKYQCHKTYLHDFSSRGSLRRVRDITTEEADAMLSSSPFVELTPPGLAFTGETFTSLLLNKGFCVVERVGDRCHIVYDHDGNHALWEGDWAFFSTDLAL